MNQRLGSRQTSKSPLSHHEYLTHKNIPIPTQAKRQMQEKEARIHGIQTQDLKPQRDEKVSLLTQEIERLRILLQEKNMEITTLKEQRSSNQYSSQYFEMNQQHQAEIRTLEDQIQGFRSRISDLKNQLEQYMGDLNKGNTRYQECLQERDRAIQDTQQLQRDQEILKIQFREKQSECDQLKERIQMIENKHNLELSQINNNNEFQRRSQLDQQIRDMTIKFNNDRQIFENQVRQLNFTKIELENKIALLCQENERLNFRYQEMLEELEQNRVRYNSYDSDRLRNQQEVINLQTQIRKFEKDNTQYKTQIQQMADNHNKDRMKIVLQGSEIERLWLILQESDQITKLRYLELEDKSKLQIQLRQDLEIQITQIKQQLQLEVSRYIQLYNEFNLLQGNYDSISRQSKHQQSTRIIELENKLTLLSTELERLKNVENDVYIINQENLRLKTQYDSLYQQTEQFSNQENLYRIQLEQMGELNQQYSKEIQTQNDSILNYQQRIKELKLQIEQNVNELNKANMRYQDACLERDQCVQQLQNADQELQEITLELDNRQQEIQSLGTTLQLVENKHQLELREVKQQTEFQRRSQLDQQIRELTVKFNNDKQQLENQIRTINQSKINLENKITLIAQENERLQFRMNELNSELEQLKQRLVISESEKNRLQNYMNQEIQRKQQQYEQQIEKYQENQQKDRMRIVVLCSEIDRLLTIQQEFQCQLQEIQLDFQSVENKNTDMGQEVQYLKSLNNQLEQETGQLRSTVKSQKQDHENKFTLLSTELERANQTINRQQLQVQQLQQQLQLQQTQSMTLQSQIIPLQNQIDSLTKQLDQAKDYINNLNKDIDDVQQRFKLKEQQLLQEMDEVYQQCESYQTELTIYQKNNLDAGDLETKFQAEKTSWETQRYQLLTQIRDLEQKITNLNAEIRRWNMTADERTREIENWKQKFQNNQVYQELEQLKQNYNDLNQDFNDLEHNNIKLKSQIQQLEKQSQLYQSQLEDKQREVDEFSLLMSKQRRQSEHTHKESEQSRKNQFTLQNQIQQLEGQLISQKELVLISQNESQNLHTTIKYLEQSLRERDAIIQRKTDELNEKLKEIDLLRDKYQTRINSQPSQVITSTIRNTSTYSRQIKLDQENQLCDSNRYKPSSMPQKQESNKVHRSAMSVISFNQDQ
ncbi:hypothetical protein pb186bvf_006602 [Paramecium bursaria]